MFWHNFKYAFVTLIKNPALVFWTLAFPFILAILFFLAFSRLHDYDTFEPFNVVIVETSQEESATTSSDQPTQSNSSDQPTSSDQFLATPPPIQSEQFFLEALKSLGEGDNRIFNLEYTDKAHAEELLDEEKIDGFIYFDNEEPRVKIKQNGINQTVLTTVTEQISQTSKMTMEVVKTKAKDETDLATIYQDAIDTVSNTKPNITNDSRVMNMAVIEFYTLIAMACMQGAMLSVELINRCLPNISNRGKRVAVAPTKKGIIIASSLLAGYIMLFLSLVALIAFMRFILGVEFGTDILLILLLSAAGGLAAMTMGMFLSVIFKTNDGAKNVIVMIVTIVGCLFAGMFGGMKIYFDNLIPIANKVNPVGLITDGFYSLYYYDDSGRYLINLISLLVIAVLFFVLSIQSLRRQRYDSI